MNTENTRVFEDQNLNGFEEGKGDSIFNISGVAVAEKDTTEGFTEDALKENNMTLKQLLPSIHVVTTSASPTFPVNDDDKDASWGMIVPIVIIAVFLIVGGVCWAFHTWRNKRRTRQGTSNVTNTSFSRLSRSYTGRGPQGIDFVRNSTRSVTPLRASARGKVNVAPATQRQGKFTFYWDKDNWKLCPDGAIQPGLERGSRNPLSPIDEVDSSTYSDISRSYEVSAQAPFSPYHLTWVTPQAPPPSYNESEISSPEKRFRHQSVNTTSMSEDTGSGYVYGKESCHSAFFPPHNTPTTECELSQEGSSNIKCLANSENPTQTNSHCTSYPSTPRSPAEDLTTSSLDTGGDTSFVTSYQDTSYQQALRQSSEYQPATVPNSMRTSQEEYDVSGIPSLASSILYYHQRMTTNNNIVLTGKPPDFSPHAYNQSITNSIASTETHYTDNTSMLPNVGSSNTSGNPTCTSLQPSSATKEEPSSRQSLEEDLYKIVNEMSSIRANSNEAGSANKGVATHSGCAFDNIGQSYVNDVFAPATNGSVGEANIRHSVTELFRSWSVTAELDYSSLSSKATTSINTPLNENSPAWENFGLQKSKEELNDLSNNNWSFQDYNNNIDASDNINRAGMIVDINKLPMPGRKVKFDVPVLVSKTYWV